MADNFETNAGSGGVTFASDEINNGIANIHHQRVKVQHGEDGSATDVSAVSPMPVDDPKLSYALQVIEDTYGDTVSYLSKLKSLDKFGRNENIGTSIGTVMTLPSSQDNETYVSRNLITHFASASTADTQKITVEGHTVGSDVSVSTLTQTSGTATCTTGSAHGYTTGDWVLINGANESGYNGIVQITVTTTTAFTYTVASGTASPATGTITATNQNKTFVIQEVTLAGQTKTALTTPLARATRAYVNEQNRAANLVGPIYVSQDVSYSAGVPGTPSAVHLMIAAGENQSQKAATALSSSDYWIVRSFRGSVLEKTAAFADVRLEIRRPGGVFREVNDVACDSGNTVVINFEPYLIVPKNSDIRLRAVASAANTAVAGSIQGYLAEVV